MRCSGCHCFSSVILLVGWQEVHLACKKLIQLTSLSNWREELHWTAVRRTSGQSAARGRFARVRHVAPMCTPISYMLPWTHPRLHTKRYLDQIGSAVFCTAHGREPYPLHGAAAFLLKIAPSRGVFGPLSDICFLGPSRVHNPNGILIGSLVVAWLTIVIDRPTSRPRYSICNSRPHLHIMVLQCGLKTESIRDILLVLGFCMFFLVFFW